MKHSWTWYLIAFAFLVRIVLSIFTYQSDIGAFSLAGKYIAGEGKWFTFYDEVASLDAEGVLVNHDTNVIFNYQPLAYLIPSVVYLPFVSIVRHTGQIFARQDWIAPNLTNYNFLLLLYKLPMILADLGILWLLPKFFKKQKNKNIAMLLWAFNPLAIYVSSMMGQVDIIIALLILASLYFAKNNKLFTACVFVSLSALIKPIGLILIPLFAIQSFHQNKNLWRSALVSLTGVGVYILGILPYLSSASYRYYALFAEQISKSTHAGVSIAAGHDIPLFFILYTLTILFFWSKKLNLNQAIASALLSSLAFTHFHPQWLVWLMPLFIVNAIDTKDYLFYLGAIVCWFGILFSFDANLHLQLFFHSKLSLPSSLTSSSMFTELVQLSRAGLVAILIWFLSHNRGQITNASTTSDK